MIGGVLALAMGMFVILDVKWGIIATYCILLLSGILVLLGTFRDWRYLLIAFLVYVLYSRVFPVVFIKGVNYLNLEMFLFTLVFIGWFTSGRKKRFTGTGGAAVGAYIFILTLSLAHSFFRGGVDFGKYAI